MAQDEGQQQSDQLGENWLNHFESQCLQELDAEPNMEERLQSEREYAAQKLWSAFQNSATAIAQMYRDRHQGLSLWGPFRNAATAVTDMYKDSIDTLRGCIDVGVQCGKQHRTKDIIAWAKKKRRHIRREELLAFLCGKNPPLRNRGTSTGKSGTWMTKDRPSQRLSHCGGRDLETDTDSELQAFSDALALQGLNGAMSNISVGYLPHTGGTLNRNMEDLNRFILDEISRHSDSRKRSPPSDGMDSPSRKKSRIM
ncbi:UPF0472 protein C16orf72 homolog [Argonauta hians]